MQWNIIILKFGPRPVIYYLSPVLYIIYWFVLSVKMRATQSETLGIIITCTIEYYEMEKEFDKINIRPKPVPIISRPPWRRRRSIPTAQTLSHNIVILLNTVVNTVWTFLNDMFTTISSNNFQTITATAPLAYNLCYADIQLKLNHNFSNIIREHRTVVWIVKLACIN